MESNGMSSEKANIVFILVFLIILFAITFYIFYIKPESAEIPLSLPTSTIKTDEYLSQTPPPPPSSARSINLFLGSVIKSFGMLFGIGR